MQSQLHTVGGIMQAYRHERAFLVLVPDVCMFHAIDIDYLVSVIQPYCPTITSSKGGNPRTLWKHGGFAMRLCQAAQFKPSLQVQDCCVGHSVFPLALLYPPGASTCYEVSYHCLILHPYSLPHQMTES